MHQLSGKTSTKTGVAPKCTIGAADAIQLVSAENHFIASSDGKRRHPQMQCTGATRCRNSMSGTEMIPEGSFETIDVIITVLTPAICCGVGRIPNFELSNGRLGVENAWRHRQWGHVDKL